MSYLMEYKMYSVLLPFITFSRSHVTCWWKHLILLQISWKSISMRNPENSQEHTLICQWVTHKSLFSFQAVISHSRNHNWEWRAGSEDKNVYCSCNPEIWFLASMLGGSQPIISSNSGLSYPSALHWHQWPYIHIHTHTHTRTYNWK